MLLICIFSIIILGIIIVKRPRTIIWMGRYIRNKLLLLLLLACGAAIHAKIAGYCSATGENCIKARGYIQLRENNAINSADEGAVQCK